MSDSIENLYAKLKSVEVVWYEVSCGYAALIEICDLLKVVPFFGPPDTVNEGTTCDGLRPIILLD